MMRTGLGLIAGFVAWSVLWLCCNFALRSAGLLPATVFAGRLPRTRHARLARA